MRTRHAVTLVFALLLSAVAHAANGPIVILKLDDLKGDGRPGHAVPPRWQEVADFLRVKGVKSSFGIICNSLDKDDPAFVEWLKKENTAGQIEFWNHGYTHGKFQENGKEVAEFTASPEKQKEAFEKSQQLAKEKLGFPFRAFGSPFNAMNAATADVLKLDPDLTIWFYGNQDWANKAGFNGLVLPRTLNMEQPTLVPNFAAFKTQFEKGNLPPVLVLQGHPGSWTPPERLANFKQVVEFLIEQKCSFMTPSQYQASLAAK